MLFRACIAGPQAASALAAVHRTAIASSAARASCSFCFRSGAPRLITPTPLCGFPVPAGGFSPADFSVAALLGAAAVVAEAPLVASALDSDTDS